MSADTHLEWTPQRKITLQQAYRRSATVRIIRLGCIICAAICAGVMFGSIAATTMSGSGTVVERIPGDQVITMINPRFTGRNIAGEAFMITADTARRRRANPEIIDLKNPKMVNDAGDEIEALTGVYHQNDDYLELFDNVRFHGSKGYVFDTSAARAFIQEGRVEGLQPLTGQGPVGNLRSDVYEITDGGNRMVLIGNVDMTIFPDGRDRSENESKGDTIP